MIIHAMVFVTRHTNTYLGSGFRGTGYIMERGGGEGTDLQRQRRSGRRVVV
jgi:hypothetical protein